MKSRPLVLIACCAGMASVGIANALPPLCMSSIQSELNLTDSQSGLLLSCILWGMMLMFMAAGTVADRIGARYVLITGGLLTAAGFMLTSMSHSLATLCASSVLVGAGAAGIDALATPVVCVLYPETRTRVANIVHGSYPAGLALGVLIAMLLPDVGFPWRRFYMISMAVPLTALAMFALLPIPGQTHDGTTRLPVRRILGSRVFILVAVLIFIAGFSEVGPVTWAPVFVERLARASASFSAMPAIADNPRRVGAAGLLFFSLAMIVGRSIIASTASRTSPRRIIVTGFIVTIAGLLLASVSGHPMIALAGLGLTGFGISGLWPTAQAMAGDTFPAAGASMFSLLAAIGSLGCAVGPIFIGCITDRSSLRLAIGLLALVPLTGLFLALMRQSSRRPECDLN